MTEQHTIKVNVDDSEIDLCIEKIERLRELLKEVNPLLKELTSKKKLKLSLTYDLPSGSKGLKGLVVELDGKEISKAVSQSICDKVQAFGEPQSDFSR